METHSAWQVILVDWESKQYATIDASADDEDWTRPIRAEKAKGRDLHCFRHDVADTAGLKKWASKHSLAQTDVPSIMSIP